MGNLDNYVQMVQWSNEKVIGHCSLPTLYYTCGLKMALQPKNFLTSNAATSATAVSLQPSTMPATVCNITLEPLIG